MTEGINEILIEGNLKFQSELSNESKSIYVHGKLPKYPLLILTCMDPRIDVQRIFHSNPGDIFILRNAGNVYSKDVMRSILLAIFEFKIKYIIILGHLDCGMTKVDVNRLKEKLSPSLVYHICNKGESPKESIKKFFKLFTDEIKNINSQVKFLRKFPDFPKELEIIGMLYDVDTGWVFESKYFENFESKERFLINYKDCLRRKNGELTEFIKKLRSKQERVDSLNKITPFENLEHDNNINLIELKNRTLKITPKVYKIKNSGINTIKSVEILNNKKNFGNLMNLKMELIVPKITIPNFKVKLPKFELKYKDKNLKGKIERK